MIWNPTLLTSLLTDRGAPWRIVTGASPLPGPTRFPEVRSFVEDSTLVLRARIPGMKPEDLKLELTEDGLLLEGEIRPEPPAEGQRLVQSERVTGRFRRRLRVPFDLDPSTVEARLEDGFLEIRLAPRPKPDPVLIPIQGTRGAQS